MGMSVDFQSHEEIKATSKSYGDSKFVTLEVKSDAGTVTIYIHNIEDAKALYNAAAHAVANATLIFGESVDRVVEV